MKKLTFLFVLMLSVLLALDAQDMVKVTLNVDLNNVTDMYEGGGAWVFMDADWNEFYDMTDEDGDGIYSYTVEKESGSVLTYRFSYQNGEDPWSNYTEENVPVDCANGDGFRAITVPMHNISFDAVSYETCAEAPFNVTFQIDLSNAEDLYEGGAVWVYFDANWNEYYEMTDEDGDGIYTYTIELNANTDQTYRFAYQTGADPWADYVEENVPEACSNGDGFRFFNVPAADVTLPPFVYGSCNDIPTGTVNITFRVDMSAEDNPNDVQVVIKNPWIWTALTDIGEGIWSGTVEVDANNTYPYTFVNGGQDNWDEEESVPEECNFGSESAPERNISVENEDVVIDIVAFGSCDANEPEEMAVITFNVDINEVPDFYQGGSVWVYMDADWNEYYDMTDEDGDGIYTFSVEKIAGSKVDYKYAYQNGEDPWTNYLEEIVPEACANENGFRFIVMPNHDISLDPLAFGTCSDDPVSITIQVDLNHVEDLYEGGAVWVYMDPGWAEYYDMTDEDGDGIYSFILERNSGEIFNYRFAYQNGEDPWTNYTEENVPDAWANEDGFRVFEVPNTDVTLQAFVYGSCGDEVTGTINLTFRVDMSPKENPNDVQVVIKNPWIWTSLSDDGDGIWIGTVEVDANNTYPYTFVNGGQDNWDEEESVPEECNFGTESAPERNIIVGEEDIVLDIVTYGACDYVNTVDDTFTSDIKIYPNPGTDQINILMDNAPINAVQIYDIKGKVIKNIVVTNKSKLRVDISDLEAGLYLVRVEGNTFVGAKKLVID